MSPTKNESLPELVARWRGPFAWDGHDGEDYDRGVRETLLNCADELEAALTREAPTEAVSEPGAIRTLVTAANAVLAANPADDGMWTLELAVRPFNATKPVECADGCPDKQVCDYCQNATPPAPQRMAQGDACEDCPTHAELRRLLDKERGIVKRLVTEDDERFAQEQAATQPPHQDRGEQRAFESWAEGAGLPMQQHPLHYLFLERVTNAARQAWKAALEYAALTEAKQQGPGEAVRHDAESWGNALNEAAWVFVEQCPEKSALLFNNTKTPLRAAILKYLELVGPTAPKVEAKRQTGEGS